MPIDPVLLAWTIGALADLDPNPTCQQPCSGP